MAHRILSIDRGSPADMAGLREGDELTHINGTLIIDFLDYQAETAYRRLKVQVKRDGTPMEIMVRKDEYEPLGCNFAAPMMSGTRMCCNKCIFCFVDQLPCNVRETMRVKDDDWRMSMMMGNYVTMTNVSDRELERIIRLHASPLYISVHASNPELRSYLIGTPRAARLKEQLKKLSDGGIEFHCQAVLCPGVNDGPALEETIRDLTVYDGALSLALVPVGLTNHREGLKIMRKYTPEEAREVIRISETWRERLLSERGTRFVFPSDEFYLQAGVPIPPDEAYEDYGQIDDGVGLLRLLETEFGWAYDDLDDADKQRTGGKKILIASGVSASDFIRDMLSERPVTGTEVQVIAVENRFFGSNVTVAGLITGGDLADRIRDIDCDTVLITSTMLRDGGDCFLDDLTLPQVMERSGKKIVPVGRRGEDLLEALLDARE